jgi:hypothetical protein
MIDGGIELVTLYERKSASGRPYMVGLMGKVRVLLLRDDRAELSEGTVGAWQLIMKPREEGRSQPRSQAASSSAKRVSRPRRANAPAAPAKPSTAQQKAIADINSRYRSDLNDPVGEL